MPKPRRRTARPYEKISQRTLQPKPGQMSARALGELVHLLSRPANWVTSAEKLAEVFTEGKLAMKSALQELESLGYLARCKVPTGGGRWGWIWIFGDDADQVSRDYEELRAKHGPGPAEKRRPGLPEGVVPGPGYPF